MRKKKSMINTVISIIMYVLTILIGLVVQAIFIRSLGSEYLGLNGLFTNIISVLAIVELGFGSAIIYNLYRPLAENKIELIKALMQYYKKIYRKIAVIVFGLGICIIPFLPKVVGSVSVHQNLYLIFVLYLFDSIASYLLTYKRSILYADQKTYVINLVHLGYLLLMNGLQIYDLLVYKNFLSYLLIKVIFRIVENLIITFLANRYYPYIKEKQVIKLDERIKADIVKKVKGLFFHQIGTAIITGTDNIIISMTPSLGVVTVGVYSNYNMVIVAITNLFSQIYSSLTASVGNLLIEGDRGRSYSIYRNMLLLNSWVFAFVSVSVLCIMEPFITIWIGSNFILPKRVLFVLTINLYV